MEKHIAMLRSICETFNGGTAYCTCGKPCKDKIHYTTTELKKPSIKKKLGLK